MHYFQFRALTFSIMLFSYFPQVSSPSDAAALSKVRPGDRVVVAVPVGQDYAAQRLQAELAQRGVTDVELQYERNPLSFRRQQQQLQQLLRQAGAGGEGALAGEQAGNSSAAAGAVAGNESASSVLFQQQHQQQKQQLVEDMDPLRIFDDYMSHLLIKESNNSIVNSDANSSVRALSTDADRPSQQQQQTPSAASIHLAVLAEGRATLERLMNAGSSSSAASSGDTAVSSGGDAPDCTGAAKDLNNNSSSRKISSSSNSNKIKDLWLENVTLSNFGPYGGAGSRPIVYPLADRGLVLIRGQSMDGTGADSNGAGKVGIYIL